VVSFNVGSRTNKTLQRVIATITLAQAKKIITDKLINYKYLIEKAIHSTKNKGTNHIERNNLSIRTHLKRLSRKKFAFREVL
jgi:insertion element IS1 protein InsB